MEIAAFVFALIATAAAAFFFTRWQKAQALVNGMMAEAAQATEKLAAMEREIHYKTDQLPTQFENLANKVLEASSSKLVKASEENLGQLLNPLKERLQEFQKKVDDSFGAEAKERFALKKEIENIVSTNEKMRLEAENLTNALKGNVKVQGNWGEHVLEMLLQSSGLHEGTEYITQGRDMKLTNDSGGRLQPDIIIKLPDGKHLIIDSKVSLTHYEQVVNATAEEEREQGKGLFLGSVRTHVKGLSDKDYAAIDGLSSPDFVLMFMPIEGAHALALQSDNNLFPFAWDKKVAIVSPTTLMPILKTVASLWKLDKQNKHTLEIARQGGNLYDKFVTFVESMEKIGKSLGDTRKTYDEAMNRLSTGQGNLIARAEKIKTLGAKASKSLPEGLLADALDEEEPTKKLEEA